MQGTSRTLLSLKPVPPAAGARPSAARRAAHEPPGGVTGPVPPPGAIPGACRCISHNTVEAAGIHFRQLQGCMRNPMYVVIQCCITIVRIA